MGDLEAFLAWVTIAGLIWLAARTERRLQCLEDKLARTRAHLVLGEGD